MLEHKPDGCGKMSYTYIENVKMCRFNDKGFIYRLIESVEAESLMGIILAVKQKSGDL